MKIKKAGSRKQPAFDEQKVQFILLKVPML